MKLIDTTKTDIRIIKTKKAIWDATLKLLSSKHPDEISITELAQTAQINRKTFYNYYSNIHQVVDDIENAAVDKFVSAIKSNDWYDGNELDCYNIFFCITEAVRDNMDFFRPLLNISRTSTVITKVENRLKDLAKVYFKQYLEMDDALLDISMDYVVSGMFSVFQRWLQNGQKMTVAEVTEHVGLMSLGCVNAVLEKYQVNTKKLTL